jgi:hypothetical protein
MSRNKLAGRQTAEDGTLYSATTTESGHVSSDAETHEIKKHLRSEPFSSDFG